MPSSPEVCPTVCPHDELNLKVFRSRWCARLNSRAGAGPVFSRLLFAPLFLLLLSVTTVSVATAQSPTATLAGTVTDQNNAVIPGVNIAVISIAQGFQRSAVTDGDGAFVVTLLPAGNYTVKAEHEGFTTAEARDIVLNVNDRVALKMQLKVGALTGQQVDVLDRPSLIDE